MQKLNKNLLKIKNPNTNKFEDLPIFIGKSAYDIAKENGFEGTEEEWLNSLKVETNQNFISLQESVSNLESSLETHTHTVDSALSSISTNPVQNKVITNAINSKTGKSTAGKEYTLGDDTTVIADTGAEVFNDYIDNIAAGSYSHAEGYHTTASGRYSHVEGTGARASGNASHAEGSITIASGYASHAEGADTLASGYASHAEGEYTIASSNNQHVQGKYNIEDTNDKYAHIVGNGEGYNKRSNAHTLDWNGNAWFAGKVYVGGTSQDDAVELTNVTVDDVLSDTSTNPVQNKTIKAALDTLSSAGVVVDSTLSTESANPVQNKVITEAINGVNTLLETHTSDSNIHVTESEKQAWNNKSDFSGKYTDLTDIPTDLATTGYVDQKVSDLVNSAPETLNTLNELAAALGNDENFATTVTNSLAEKASNVELETHTSDSNIHVTVQDKENWNNKTGKSTTGKEYTIDGKTVTANDGAEVFNDYINNIASGYYSHAEGYKTRASGSYSHAEGYNTISSSSYAHSEGWNTTASGYAAHAEGYNTQATGTDAHAEGSRSVASGELSHAEGWNTTASGYATHSEGYYTEAFSDYQHVQGQFNIVDENNRYAHIVGNGDFDVKSNAHTLDWSGNAWFAGDVYVGGTSQDDASTLASTTYVDNKVADIANNIDLSNYYTKSDIDSMEFISIADIDEICGANIVSGNEVTY